MGDKNRPMDKDKLSCWLKRWDLIPDGTPFHTHTSQLLPVKTAADGAEAMLKVTADRDEQTGNSLLVWWAGKGAAQVIAHEDEAILLARATGSASLATMSREGQDLEACRILCATANRLHRVRQKPLPQLPSLDDWFASLKIVAQQRGGLLAFCSDISQELLTSPQDVVALHGDLHHGNVLDFASSGWRAIDPKGVIGERGFDFANIFTNPDLDNPAPPVATVPEIFKRRLRAVSEIANLDRERLLKWIIAWGGLSAAWSLESESANATALRVATLAIEELRPALRGHFDVH
ncbi:MULTISPECIES: aminoglycoside phosphotransferase family protein [Enterobacteriaceae]|uniref:aminoglycoside phosphotransferase family protein n=1 Tax=Enterobacteriaceae TaxID=543 RepID=UPI000272B0CD|nr:streptomycin 3''-kinase [Enterobacter sp. Ag1]